MVVRELLLGPKRFSDIRRGLPKLSADVLSQRLRGLEEAGVIAHRRLPPPVSAQVYELTPKGLALEPVLIELGRWGGGNAPDPEPDMCMSIDAHLVSLRTLFDPARAEGFEAEVELILDGEPFAASIAGGSLEVERGEPARPEATIESSAGTLLDVLHGRRELREAIDAGDMRLSGDADVARRFTTLFPLPVPAGA